MNKPRKRHLVASAAVVVAVLVLPGAVASAARDGGIFRIAFQQLSFDYVDPALASSVEARALLDTTCARLLTYPDKPPPAAIQPVPEVAASYPRASRDLKTWTFTLRHGFRFSDGTPVRADAFARAINRTLAPGVTTPALQYTQTIVGAADVRAGRIDGASGIVARGNTLVVHLARPVADFPAWTTMSYFCAVPPGLQPDPEGVTALPSAGPYYIAEYRPADRVVIRRNRYYGGSRPHHVDGFDVDLHSTSPGELLDRVERGESDWSYTTPAPYFDASRGLIAKYGVNRSRFFVRPGLTLQVLVLNSSRPLFANNPRLRRAVNLALDRSALAATAGGPGVGAPTYQHLPRLMPGFRDAGIGTGSGADVARARSLAAGLLRDGKAIFYVPDFPQPRAVAQLAGRELAEIGLDVELNPIPLHVTSSGYLGRLGAPGEAWDIALLLWTPDYVDPYAYLNRLLDPNSIGATGLAGFDSPGYTRLLRQAAGLGGAARYRRYGELDADLARNVAPVAPIQFLNEATLVSERVGCIVLRPVLDLTAACLKP